jgi:peptidyl-prolyl cis-trans isomerase SurA
VSGFLLAVAVSGLTACRTSPSVAAYVGDERVTVDELEAAVDERTEDEQVAAFAAQDEAAYTRQVLALLVQEEVHDEAAERYGVDVTDADVRARIEALLGGDDPETVFDQLAQQGIARPDVEETVRQQLVRREIAVSEGRVEEPTDEDLQAQYEQAREGLAEVELGYINVPDQAAADALQARLQADPSQYAAAAAEYAGEFTLPEVAPRPLAEVPGPLTEQVAAASPGTVSSQTVDGVEGLIVTFVGETVYPTLDEIRPQLEQEFTQAADAAGAELVSDVRNDIDVVLNPRYGDLEDTGEIVPGGGGVVQLLEESAAGQGAGGGTAPE